MFGNIFDKKKKLIGDLDRIQQDIMSMPDSSSLLNNETSIKNQINQVLVNEEIYWAQKAKVNWLHLGDKNKKYFQSVTNIKKKRNEIFKRKGHQGNWWWSP